jgi:hypothetical protein
MTNGLESHTYYSFDLQRFTSARDKPGGRQYCMQSCDTVTAPGSEHYREDCVHNKQSRNEPPGRWTPRGDRTDCKKSRHAYPGCRTNRAACTNSCQSCFSSPGLGHFPGGLRTVQAVEKRAPRSLDSPGKLDRVQEIMTCEPRSPDEPGGRPRLRAVVRCVPRAFGSCQPIRSLGSQNASSVAP